jgi:hypothetical protein
VNDGKIPQKYLSQAQTFMGHYTGKMRKTPAQIVLSIDDENYVHFSYNDEITHDLLGASCDSQVGALTSFQAKNGSLDHATFSFSGGKCEIPGNELSIAFLDNSQMSVEIQVGWEEKQICQTDPERGSSCSTIQQPLYRRGKFNKVD